MNNPNLYQIEDPSVNRGHGFEEKDAGMSRQAQLDSEETMTPEA